MSGVETVAPSRARLREHLIAARIAGDVATTRENNLRKYALMAGRDPRHLFGLDPRGAWSPADVLALMARVCGVNPDPSHSHGQDRIDPDRTIAALDLIAARLRQAADRGERVLVATGHPAGLLAVHLELARALRAAGCTLMRAGVGWAYETRTVSGVEPREIRYLGDVAMLSHRGALSHTHSARPIRAILRMLAETGEPLPDLVVADHGWAGGAGQAGIDAVGFADSNDPALFVGEAEGRLQAVAPLDDNVAPHLYEPLTAYLLSSAKLTV